MGGLEKTLEPQRPGSPPPLQAKDPSQQSGNDKPHMPGAQPKAEQASSVAPVSSGRATHRGGANIGEPRPGQAALAQKMQSMNIRDKDDKDGQRQSEWPQRKGDFAVERYTRPKHLDDKRGKAGDQIQLYSNFFKMEMFPNYSLHQYDVKYSPEIHNKKMRTALLNNHKDLIGPVRAFDGHILFLPKRLQDKTTVKTSQLKSTGQNVKLTITHRAEIPPNSESAVAIFNIVFKRVLRMMDCEQIQRHYYAPSLAIPIPKHKLEVWPGYTTTIANYENNLMLTADMAFKILRSDTVLAVMEDIREKHLSRGNFKEEIIRQLVGQTVLTRYNNKTYRIDDIDFSKTASDSFKTTNRKLRQQRHQQPENGEPQEFDLTYCEYIQTRHNITVTKPKQPLIVSRPKIRDLRKGQTEEIHLVPELCSLTGLPDEALKDFNMMKDLAVHTRVGPDGRVKNLKNFIDRINSQENVQQELSGWGLKFANGLIKINARQLPAEVLTQGNNVQYSYDRSRADWERELRGKHLIGCKELKNWLFVYGANRDAENAQNFLQALMRVGPPMGFNVARPQQLQLSDTSTASFIRTIKANLKSNPQMVVCMMPTARKDLYDSIKKLCCLEHAVPSQCFIGKTVMKRDRVMSVATKIGLQMNVKLGGQPWAADIPLHNAMVCGIDTYHDSAVKGRSAAAIVCTLDKAYTRFFSKVTLQSNKEELHRGLTVNLAAALKKYHEVNQRLPEKIIVYRDGVGDGMMDTVCDIELPQIQEAFAMIGSDYKPKFGFVVVKKRITTRLFARAGKQAINPPPGTVVDSEVTRPEMYDFFLVSQNVRQGSVTPCHYNVIHDNFGFKPDHYQRLTYKLCHLYYNWAGTIKVPAPCMYAHKLAFLVGQSLHSSPGSELADKLYYL